MSENQKIYLGDGVYAHRDGHLIVLEAENENGMNRIYVEPEVMDALARYAGRVWTREPSKTLEDGDYEAPNGCWLTIGKASVRAVPRDEGVSVTIYRLGDEMSESLGETWVTNAELEEDADA